MDSPASRKLWAHRVFTAILAIAGLVGWWFYFEASQQSRRAQEAEARTAQLEAERDTLISERDQLRTRVSAALQSEAELVVAQEELRKLREERDRLSTDLELMRATANSRQPEPEAVGATASAPRANVDAVQRALVGAGFGPLQIDGALGPKTREAIRSFERAHGLPVTGEINARFLQALQQASGQPLQ
jgi:Putative peptidoglycan binding domain